MFFLRVKPWVGDYKNTVGISGFSINTSSFLVIFMSYSLNKNLIRVPVAGTTSFLCYLCLEGCWFVTLDRFSASLLNVFSLVSMANLFLKTWRCGSHFSREPLHVVIICRVYHDRGGLDGYCNVLVSIGVVKLIENT